MLRASFVRATFIKSRLRTCPWSLIYPVRLVRIVVVVLGLVPIRFVRCSLLLSFYPSIETMLTVTRLSKLSIIRLPLRISSMLSIGPVPRFLYA
jgi:hypothetical protein